MDPLHIIPTPAILYTASDQENIISLFRATFITLPSPFSYLFCLSPAFRAPLGHQFGLRDRCRTQCPAKLSASSFWHRRALIQSSLRQVGPPLLSPPSTSVPLLCFAPPATSSILSSSLSRRLSSPSISNTIFSPSSGVSPPRSAPKSRISHLPLHLPAQHQEPHPPRLPPVPSSPTPAVVNEASPHPDPGDDDVDYQAHFITTLRALSPLLRRAATIALLDPAHTTHLGITPPPASAATLSSHALPEAEGRREEVCLRSDSAGDGTRGGEMLARTLFGRLEGQCLWEALETADLTLVSGDVDPSAATSALSALLPRSARLLPFPSSAPPETPGVPDAACEAIVAAATALRPPLDLSPAALETPLWAREREQSFGGAAGAGPGSTGAAGMERVARRYRRAAPFDGRRLRDTLCTGGALYEVSDAGDYVRNGGVPGPGDAPGGPGQWAVPGALRCQGSIWVSSRPDVEASLSSCGAVCVVEPVAAWGVPGGREVQVCDWRAQGGVDEGDRRRVCSLLRHRPMNSSKWMQQNNYTALPLSSSRLPLVTCAACACEQHCQCT